METTEKYETEICRCIAAGLEKNNNNSRIYTQELYLNTTTKIDVYYFTNI